MASRVVVDGNPDTVHLGGRMPAAGTARRRRAVPVRHRRSRDTSPAERQHRRRHVKARHQVYRYRRSPPRPRRRHPAAPLASALIPAGPLAASPRRCRGPGFTFRRSPPRAGRQLNSPPPPGNSAAAIASGSGCHHLPVQHPRGRRDEPPTV